MTQSTNNTNTAFFPDDFFKQCQINHPTTVQTIKGTVERLTPYPKEEPKWIYGDLVGIDATIGFRCPIHNAPRAEGEHVLLQGTITIETNKIGTGLNVTLYGEPIGTWTPDYQAAKRLIQLTRQGRTSLNTFIQTHDLQSLLVLATNRGDSDYITAAKHHGLADGWIKHNCNFADKNKLLADFDKAISRYPSAKAIAFVRGGSDSTTLRIWNDPVVINHILKTQIPFYTAIGHSDRLLLADKYCDESFTTPTEFGMQLGQIMADIQKYNTMTNTLDDQQQLINQLSEQQAQHDQNITHIKQRYRKYLTWTIGTSVLLTLGAAGWWWLTQHGGLI